MNLQAGSPAGPGHHVLSHRCLLRGPGLGWPLPWDSLCFPFVGTAYIFSLLGQFIFTLYIFPFLGLRGPHSGMVSEGCSECTQCAVWRALGTLGSGARFLNPTKTLSSLPLCLLFCFFKSRVGFVLPLEQGSKPAKPSLDAASHLDPHTKASTAVALGFSVSSAVPHATWNGSTVSRIFSAQPARKAFQP